MPKQAQRDKARAQRVRKEHALRTAATEASRRKKRVARTAVGLVATLGILFLGVLGTSVRQEAAVEQPGPSTTVTTAPAAADDRGDDPGGDDDLEPPPCPAEDGSSPRRTLFDRPPEMCIDPAKDYQARFVTTAGIFIADLYPKRSPLAVNNFVFLARYHFYDDLPFHRVVSGFYAQTGDPVDPDHVGPGYTFDDDPLPPVGTYKVGSLVFAHEEADQNGSQFLIWLGPEVSQLPHVFPLFGQVISGQGTLTRIDADGGTAEEPRPDTPHRIERIDIIER